jgi:gas vesicle protein
MLAENSSKGRWGMRRFFNFVTGATLGALVGASLALLLAPYSGQQLRDKAQERWSNLLAEVRAAYEAQVAQLEAELESMRHPTQGI